MSTLDSVFHLQVSGSRIMDTEVRMHIAIAGRKNSCVYIYNYYIKCLGHGWHCIGIKWRALNTETSRAKINKQIHKFFAVATWSFTRLGDHQATDRLCLIIRLNTFHVSWFQVTYELGLSITALTNQQRTNFLDITFDLANDTYKPYRKPNDEH